MFGHILGILEMSDYWIFYNKERYGLFKLFLIFYVIENLKAKKRSCKRGQ